MERRKFLKLLTLTPLLLLFKPEKSEALSPLLSGKIGKLDGMRIYDSSGSQYYGKSFPKLCEGFQREQNKRLSKNIDLFNGRFS